VNVAVVFPEATVTLAGTVTAALLLDKVTLTLAGADAVRAAVQVVLPGALIAAEAQDKDESCGGATWVTESVNDLEAPLRVAVSITELCVDAPAVAVAENVTTAVAENVALLWPAATVTLGGTTTAGLLLSTTMVAPPAGAGADRFTVHVVVPGGLIAADVQAKELSCTMMTKLMERVKVLEPPLRVAVTMAVWFEVTCAAAAGKVAVVCPALTVTLAGTVTVALLLNKVTLAPPDGAGADKVTVHVLLPGALIVAGVQVNALGWTEAGKVTVADWL